MSDQATDLDRWMLTPAGQYLLAWEQARYDQAVVDIFGYHSVQIGMPQLLGLRTNRMPSQWLAQLPPSSGLLDHASEKHDGHVKVCSPSATNLSSSDLSSASNSSQLPPSLRSSHDGEGHFGKAAILPARNGPSDPGSARTPHLLLEPAALPFDAGCIDLLLLPHALESSADRHAALREAHRVLVPEGRVVISGFNPLSLWGLRQQRDRWWNGGNKIASAAAQGLGWRKPGAFFLPQNEELIGYWRLRDWLQLLGFEIEEAYFGCYTPPLKTKKWMDRFAWMDRFGPYGWPIFGAAYFVVAVKRVPAVRVMGPSWRKVPQTSTAAAPVAASTRPLWRQRESGDDQS